MNKFILLRYWGKNVEINNHYSLPYKRLLRFVVYLFFSLTFAYG